MVRVCRAILADWNADPGAFDDATESDNDDNRLCQCGGCGPVHLGPNEFDEMAEMVRKETSPAAPPPSPSSIKTSPITIPRKLTT